MAIAAAPRTPARAPAAAGQDAQVLGGQRQRALVDDLADAGQQALAGRGQRAADHDHRGVDQVDQRREHLAEVAAGLADHVDGARVAAAHQLDDVVAGGGRRTPRRAERGRQRRDRRRPPRGSPGCRSGRSRRRRAATRTWPRSPAVPWAPRWSSPPEMMPAPMPVRDLDEDQVVDVGQVGVPLAQGHDVDVVVDEHRDVEVALHVAGHVVAVPAGHDRRVDRAAGRVLDGPGQADADRGQRRRRRGAARRSSARDRRADPAEHGLGAGRRCRGPARRSASTRPGEVGERGAGVRGADVDARRRPGRRG